jgi:hypothetical protein
MKKFLILTIALSLIAFTAPAMADVSAGADSESSANLSLDQSDHSTNTYEATEARPNSGPVPIPGQPGWFTTPTPDGDFITMKNILEFGKVFSEGALENMADGGWTRVTYAMVNPEARVSARAENDRRILIVIDPARIKEIAAGGTHVAFVNGAAKNGKTNSVQLMAAMALKALKSGANVVVFKAEGAHRKVEAFGWGIGFSHVKASENNMSTGGTGISGGSAGPEDRPWLQGNAFVNADVQAMLDALK